MNTVRILLAIWSLNSPAGEPIKEIPMASMKACMEKLATLKLDPGKTARCEEITDY